MIYRVV